MKSYVQICHQTAAKPCSAAVNGGLQSAEVKTAIENNFNAYIKSLPNNGTSTYSPIKFDKNRYYGVVNVNGGAPAGNATLYRTYFFDDKNCAIKIITNRNNSAGQQDFIPLK